MRTTLLQRQKGFFVAELIVAIFIFGIVMTISMGALVTSLDSNKKTQSLKSVINNLNIVLDTMTKTVATGSRYYCGELPSVPYTEHSDCLGGQTINFLINEDLDKNGTLDDYITYKYVPNLGGGRGGGYIGRVIHTGSGGEPVNDNLVRMTAPEVDITDLRFYVIDSARPEHDPEPGSYEQAKILIVIKGKIPGGPRTAPTEFTLQNTISQRVPDFNLDE